MALVRSPGAVVSLINNVNPANLTAAPAQVVDQAVQKNSAPVTTIAAAGSAVALAVLNYGNASYDVTLTAASCAFTISGFTAGAYQTVTVLVRQDATGGRAFTLPGSVKWSNGSALVPVTTVGTVLVFSLTSTDGGVTIVAK